ncbi:hypothetical protein [Heterosigma akashiwo virus 01]|uniref:Uncharacterized protein n=1 Tax=Heterosigma akashiwo virus 01 TaxID=97195 RepID=A0A1C9C555_HAV01|nr:hypothetical protein D1R72_gp084 [Heterosigma akashiwo virus 01]AOM63415.1 hypothetical protein [Heterosigma akashiwo virus 01]
MENSVYDNNIVIFNDDIWHNIKTFLLGEDLLTFEDLAYVRFFSYEKYLKQSVYDHKFACTEYDADKFIRNRIQFYTNNGILLRRLKKRFPKFYNQTLRCLSYISYSLTIHMKKDVFYLFQFIYNFYNIDIHDITILLEDVMIPFVLNNQTLFKDVYITDPIIHARSSCIDVLTNMTSCMFFR